MSEFVICYDIRDRHRLARLHRYLKKYAVPMQYSVFLFVGDHRQLDQCLADASALIDPKEDDLRAYPLPQSGLRARLGRGALPQGIYWSGLPEQW